MNMNLRCPNCGFAFGVYCNDDITEEEKTGLMTCPCGTLMEQTEELHAVVLEED